MIRTIDGLPDNVVAVEAIGTVDATDYKTVLDPAISSALAAHEKIRLLYLLGSEFSGFSGGAMWEDAKTGVGHWTSWEKIALVTDTRWVADGVKAFGWMVPGEVRTFGLAELDAAKSWLTD